MTTLLIAEHDNASIKDATNKTLTAAAALGADVHVLVAGENAKGAADAAAKLAGVKKVLLADGAPYAHDLAEPLAVAKILKAIAEQEKPGLIILGKQAIDDDSNQTGQMLAALLGWSQATFASKLEVDGADFKVTREVDGGLQTVKLKGPAIVTTDRRLNEPRYASLPNIMKARTKPMETKQLNDLGLDLHPHLKVLKVSEPPKRQAGIKVESAAELVAKLKTEAGVL